MPLKMRITGFLALIILLAACVQPASAAENSGYEVKVTIPVSCDLGGTVEVTRTDEDAPAPEPKKLILKYQKNDYVSITFDEPGTYRYRFAQKVKKKDPAVIYDLKPYDVTVFVSCTDDTLKPFITVMQGGVKTDLVHFNNRRKPAGPVKKPAEPARAAAVKTGDSSGAWRVPAIGALLVICLAILARRKGGSV